MTVALATRKRVELEQKLAALDDEFGDWIELSQAGGQFEKHHTQVLVLTSGLREFAAKIRSQLDQAKQPEDLLGAARNLQSLILAVRRIWEYFRSKWVQRREDKFFNYLRAADELVWSFYEPVLRHRCPTRVSPCRREPPLVFLNGGLSPFAVSRDQMFQAEEVFGQALPDDRGLYRYLHQLPIPVIGVPWFQIRHLPDALVLAHEAGHAIENDFAFHDELESKYATISSAWRAWQREVFADLFGCLVMGPFFLGTLIDFLAVSKTDITLESRLRPNWGDYPTGALRVLLCAAALRHEALGFKTEADALLAQWTGEYPNHSMPEYEKDFSAIIAATLTQPLKALNCALADVSDLRFTRDQIIEVTTTAQSLADGTIPETLSIRVLFAGLRSLFEKNPTAMQTQPSEKNRAEKACEQKHPVTIFFKTFQQISRPGTRLSDQQLTQEELDSLAEQSKSLGAEMFEQAMRQLEN